MKIEFTKYHGTANDFILIDDRKSMIQANLKTKHIKQLCQRRFGIGADGLILLQEHETLDFNMKYYNSDGRLSSMCGNGARCLVHFANGLKVFKKSCRFMAVDGEHEAFIEKDLIHLKMSDVYFPSKKGKDFTLDTGSPHYIKFVDDITSVNVKVQGSRIRNGKAFLKKGINVNFVESKGNSIKVATFERGVEDETYSCGTGVVAAAIANHFSSKSKSKNIAISTKGGKLKVKFDLNDTQYQDVWLIGPAVVVSKGEVNI